MVKRWGFLVLGVLMASTAMAAEPVYRSDLSEISRRASAEGFFQPSFFSSQGRNLEVVEQGPRSIKWSSQILRENNEFESLLAQGGLRWSDIRALHLSRLYFGVSKAQSLIGPEGSKISKIPCFFSIGLEFPSPRTGQSLRVTMEVQAFVIVTEESYSRVRVEAYGDSNPMEAFIRQHDKSFEALSRFYGAEFARMIGEKVLENFLNPSQLLNSPLDSESREALAWGEKTRIELFEELERLGSGMLPWLP